MSNDMVEQQQKKGKKSASSKKSTNITGDITQEEPKKRSRKPIEKSYSVLEVSNIDNIIHNDDPIILELHINMEEIDDNRNLTTASFKYNPVITEPKPYEPDSNFDVISGNKDESAVFASDKSSIKSMLFTNESGSASAQQSIDKSMTTMNADTNAEEGAMPMSMPMPISMSMSMLTSDERRTEIREVIVQTPYSEGKMKLIQKNIHNTMFEFIDTTSSKGTWPSSTSIYCMWDCHPFDGPQCSIPTRYVDGKFYLYGCFCSFNCAMAYIFDQKSSIKWEQYPLLLLLYKKITGDDYANIKIAPPRHLLKIFGGTHLIEEFRKNFRTLTSYSVIYPPMISIVPKLEENIFELSKVKYIPVNQNMIKEASATLKLKREKAVGGKLTVDSFMRKDESILT